MISMSRVWDRTTEVIAGRFAMLASIAVITLLAPPIAQAAVTAITATAPGMRIVASLVGMAVALLALVGTLALTAVATDPTIDQRQALHVGGSRLGAMIGVSCVIVSGLFLTIIPGLALIATSGFDVTRAQAGLAQTGADAGRLLLGSIFLLVTFVVWLWLFAKLVPLAGVVVNERRGIGAIRRSFALTRGSTAKLFGVLILYAIVTGVVWIAVTSVLGVVTRLLVGPDALVAVTFVSALGAALVASAFSIVQSVFSAQFYLAARERLDRA